MSTLRPLLVNVKLRIPACVMLQAATGGDTQLLNSMFNSLDWDVSNIEDMKLVYGTDEQWRSFAAELERRRTNAKIES